jgi:hypothetical protein
MHCRLVLFGQKLMCMDQLELHTPDLEGNQKNGTQMNNVIKMGIKIIFNEKRYVLCIIYGTSVFVMNLIASNVSLKHYL